MLMFSCIHESAQLLLSFFALCNTIYYIRQAGCSIAGRPLCYAVGRTRPWTVQCVRGTKESGRIATEREKCDARDSIIILQNRITFGFFFLIWNGLPDGRRFYAQNSPKHVVLRSTYVVLDSFTWCFAFGFRTKRFSRTLLFRKDRSWVLKFFSQKKWYVTVVWVNVERRHVYACCPLVIRTRSFDHRCTFKTICMFNFIRPRPGLFRPFVIVSTVCTYSSFVRLRRASAIIREWILL